MSWSERTGRHFRRHTANEVSINVLVVHRGTSGTCSPYPSTTETRTDVDIPTDLPILLDRLSIQTTWCDPTPPWSNTALSHMSAQVRQVEESSKLAAAVSDNPQARRVPHISHPRLAFIPKRFNVRGCTAEIMHHGGSHYDATHGYDWSAAQMGILLSQDGRKGGLPLLQVGAPDPPLTRSLSYVQLTSTD